MSDDASPLPWTAQHWADLRTAAMDSARRSRVASTFLPLVGPLPADQVTVPSNWMMISEHQGTAQPGEADYRLEVRAGKTLHLVTIACNVFLRGSEIADPELVAAKAMVRRAAEVLGRLEDAIIFQGLPRTGGIPMSHGAPVVQPLIYTVTGGRDLTGLLQAPDTLFDARARVAEAGLGPLKSELDTLARRRRRAEKKVGKGRRTAATAMYDEAVAEDRVRSTQERFARDIMVVPVRAAGPDRHPIVEAVVEAVQKLEAKGHFGPFAVVLGEKLFSDATSPSGSLVLPTDRLVEFLDGRRVMRSGALPPGEGVVVALGGQAIELVLARDVDVAFLQVTMEPRYVLRVFERFVLRIKELDAVCRVTSSGLLLTPGFVPRRAES